VRDLLLHLGDEEVIHSKDVLAILDMNALKDSELAKEFLAKHQRDHTLTDLSNSAAKSVIITDQGIYLSPLSASTLKKRAADRLELENGWNIK
jgi:extracellular matrix regulatory protein B